MKAILPVAGWGTRMRPLTWSVPKYLLGVADKPLIQYTVDELGEAGIKDLAFVISPNQGKVKEYVTKHAGLKRVRFALQRVMRGNADAILKAKSFLNSQESAIVSHGDDVLVGGDAAVEKMIALSKKTQAPVLLLERVPRELVSRYGIAAVRPLRGKSGLRSKDMFEVTKLVEKPKLEEAPSNLSVIGRYVVTPEIFKEMKVLCANKDIAKVGKEFYLTDALVNYMNKGGRVFAIEFKGARFDCGSKLGLMKANAYFGAQHKEFGKDLRAFLKTL